MIQVDHISAIATELGIDDANIQLRKSFLEFTEAEAKLLQDLHGQIKAYGDQFAEAFYEHVLSFPALKSLAGDQDSLTRLKKTQSSYFQELTKGCYDLDYVLQRLGVGIKHQRVGLEQHWYIGSFCKYLSYFLPLIWQLFDADKDKALPTYNALLKVVMFDMQLAIETYSYADKMAVLQLEQRLRNLVDGIDAIIWEFDAASMQCTFISHRAVAVLGYPVERWLGEPDFWSSIIIPEDREQTITYCLQEISAGRDYEAEYRVSAADGRTVWIHERVTIAHNGNHNGARLLRGVMIDITVLKETENKLVYLATHDELTGLPNRSLLQDRLVQAMVQADQNRWMVALLFIDLDRFKFINDSKGHDIGDIVLQTAAARLLDCVHEVDSVARLGGDEFLVMLSSISKLTDISIIAQKVLENLSAPFQVHSDEFFLSASIGISVYPKDGLDAQSLLKNADLAMYRAKDAGKDRFEFFTAEMNVAAERRLHLENQLRQALERQEFVLHYQPQIDLTSKRVVGVEALMRWQNPELGLVPPIEFIPLAEETSLIVLLGEWALETACKQAKIWQSNGLPGLRMGVNLSARQFSQQGLIETVRQILSKTGLDPELLDLELTESMLMQGAEDSIAILHGLRKIGVCLSMDDFGTGYSSLSYLSRFPMTAVKIDQSFVRSITNQPDAAALARSIISMAREMRLRVIAEGVETEQQLAFLVSHQCDEVQGYYFSRPLPAEEFVAWYKQYQGQQFAS